MAVLRNRRAKAKRPDDIPCDNFQVTRTRRMPKKKSEAAGKSGNFRKKKAATILPAPTVNAQVVDSPSTESFPGPSNESAAPRIDVQWKVRDKLPADLRANTCFVCHKIADSTHPLVTCQHSFEATDISCSTQFHEECLRLYNAGGFNYEYMKKEKGVPVCPLHHCHVCYLERRKTTAMQGDLVQCNFCYKSFHESCLPANLETVDEKEIDLMEIDKDGKPVACGRRYCVCFGHQARTLSAKVMNSIKPRQHLKFCAECLNTEKNAPKKGKLLQCGNCFRSYHAQCRRFNTILPEDGSGNWCESCVLGEVYRVGEYVIARWKNGWYPAITVEPSQYPNQKKKRDKFGAYNGGEGFLTLSWLGYNETYAVIPYQHLIQLTSGMSGLFHCVDNLSRAAWRELDAKYRDRVIPVPLPTGDELADGWSPKDNYSTIRGSCYHSDKAKIYVKCDMEALMCDCEKGVVGRCGPNSNCPNRAQDQECPAKCSRLPGGCANRDVRTSATCKDVKVNFTNSKGKGLFAKATIKEGTFIAEYAGEILDVVERDRREHLVKNSRNDDEMHYMMILNGNRVVDAKYKGNISRFINHSCEPNCIIESVMVPLKESKTKVQCDNRIRVVTCREIRKGEELTFDYSMEGYGDGITLPTCRCNTASCTGYLAGARNRNDGTPTKEKISEKKAPRVSSPRSPKQPVSMKRSKVSPALQKEVKTEVNSDFSPLRPKELKRSNKRQVSPVLQKKAKMTPSSSLSPVEPITEKPTRTNKKQVSPVFYKEVKTEPEISSQMSPVESKTKEPEQGSNENTVSPVADKIISELFSPLSQMGAKIRRSPRLALRDRNQFAGRLENRRRGTRNAA